MYWDTFVSVIIKNTLWSQTGLITFAESYNNEWMKHADRPPSSSYPCCPPHLHVIPSFPCPFNPLIYMLVCSFPLPFLKHTVNTSGLTISLGIWTRRPALPQWVFFCCSVCCPLLAACDPAPGWEDRRCDCRHCCCCCFCCLCCGIQALVRTHGCRRTAPCWAAVILKRRGEGEIT